MKTSKKQTPKGKPAQPDYAPRPLTNDQEKQIDAIGREHGNLGNAALNFWHGINYAPPFMRAPIDHALTCAAASFGIANPADEDDPIKQLEKLRTLYEVTGANFKLPAELTAADHLFAVLNDHDALDAIPQDLFDLLCDYFEGKIEAAGHSPTHPEGVNLPSIKMVLAAGVAADGERERAEMKPAEGKATEMISPALKWSHGDTNEAFAIKNPPYGQAAFNIYYSVDSLPPMMRAAFSDTLSDLAKKLDVPDPTDTRGEVEGFKRLIKVCKAAVDQESVQE